MNLFSLLDHAARRFPQHPAVFVGDERTLTYEDLRARTLSFAHALQQRYTAGDRVAIVSENRAEYVEIMFAIFAAGMVAVPINAKLHPREVALILDDCNPVLVVVSPALSTALHSVIVGHRDVLFEIGGAEYATWTSGAAGSVVSVAPETLAWLFYTSGTTGRSKGAMLSHRNLLAMSVGFLADVDQVDENTSLLHGAPMSHGSGLYILPYTSRAARHVVPASSGFEPDEFLALCDHHAVASAFLAPTMVQRLRVEAERTGIRPTNLRTVVYGGGPMYVEELKKAMHVFGQVFVQIYGQGEAPMTITWLRRADHATNDDAILGSVGYARTGVDVAVVDAEGTPLPIGETGEVVCRGDVVMSGYWNNPAATSETLRDGWLFTGDMGSLDARGYLTLRDRSKGVLISGGSNIYPREVEEVLLTFPGVAEACVVGCAHAEWGESVVAFIVSGADTTLSEPALDAHCLARIARYKRPRRYVFVDALPKNSYGKVLKRELRAALRDDA